ncbi:MAG: TetR/AcrR family transcriptional regulator [Acidimicrobiales bacterium]
MGRPVETDEETLLAAASFVLMTEGPAGFTLAKAAHRAGVSAATLVKRFGSKDALLRRLSQRWVDSLDDFLGAAAAPHRSPLAKLRAVALHNYRDLDHPETASKQLAALGLDLDNDEMRELLRDGWSRVQRHLERHATASIAAGELVGSPPPKQLSRIIFGVMEGGCLAWSVQPEGSLIRRLDEDLTALLRPWARGGK